MSIEGIELEPDGYHHPASERELVALVRHAYAHGLQLRVRGAAHSVVRALYTDPLSDRENRVSRQEPPRGAHINVMLDRLRCWRVRDEARRLVEAEAGIHLDVDPSDPTHSAGASQGLLRALFARGWSLSALGGITHQTVSGFVATGSAGGSLTFSATHNLYGFRVIDGRGDVHEFTRDDADPDTFFAMAPAMGLLGVVSTLILQCEPAFHIVGEERVTTYDACPVDVFGPGDGSRPSLEEWLKTRQYARVEWWPQRGGERLETWEAHRIPFDPHFKPKPYRQFGKSPVLTQFLAGVFYTVTGNLRDLGAARRKLRPACRRLGASAGKLIAPVVAFLARLLVGLVTLLLRPFAGSLERRLPGLFVRVLGIFAPLDKGKAETFQDHAWRGLPMDYEADDDLVPTGFTECWIPIGRAREVAVLLRGYFEGAATPREALDRTGTYTWELYGSPPSPFWLNPAYTDGADEWKDGVVRVDPYWFEGNPTNPAESFWPALWRLLRDAGVPFRLHWGKYQPVIPQGDPEGWVAFFRAQYPRWDDFLALRERMDPNNLFLTAYWRERFGLWGAPAPRPMGGAAAGAEPPAPAPDPSPGLTDIHAHPAMNAYFFDRDLRRHYMSGRTFNPLASLTDFPMLKKGNVRVLWSVLHVPEKEFLDCRIARFAAHFTRGGRKILRLNAWEVVIDMLEGMERQVARAGDRFQMAMAHSNAELDAVVASGRRAFVHTVEGGHVLGAGLAPHDIAGRLARLEELASRGVASLTLTHIFPTELAGHVEAIEEALHQLPLCSLDTKVDDCRGLSVIGEAVVRKMMELKMVPDLTHCTRAARRQVFQIVENKVPLVVTHTGVQALNPVSYNLIREEVQAIAATGGLVGVIFMPHWLDRHDPKKGLDVIWRTMSKLAEWGGGWGVVAIGTDFDGLTDPPDDVDNASKLPRVVDMLHRNLSTADADAVLGGNARRVLRLGWR
ncbi:MAG TPA: membrane dipeptidase [Longimicrobium sp.]